MITDTRERILTIIRSRGQSRAVELARELKISNVAVQKQLKRLLALELVEKRGVPPVVFYVPKQTVSLAKTHLALPPETQKAIDNDYLSITPDGQLLYGGEGFVYWAQIYGKGKSLTELATLYVDELKKVKNHTSPSGWMDATPKLKSVFPHSPIQRLLFAHIYSLPVFGRTKMAKLVMHAKSSQDTRLVDTITQMVRPMVDAIVKIYGIQAVAFIPPTVPRPMQFMTELEKALHISLPVIELTKVVPGAVPVPQKTLSSTSDRIINARESIYPRNASAYPYSRILLIDDVAGSGASLNETAQKLLPFCAPPVEITAFAIVGNIKGFDVIRQM